MSKIRYALKLVIASILIPLSMSSAGAATIIVERNTELSCEVYLRGEITGGDTENLRLAIKSLGSHYPLGNTTTGQLRVCLDSPGGSYSEGLNIAQLFLGLDSEFGRVVGTAVPRGAVCLSACALAFMAGTIANEAGYLTPDRIMHSSAKLGFHAPMLTVLRDRYSEIEVLQAYGIALASISKMTGLINSGRYHFPLSLLEQMLKTPHNDMLYIETFAQLFYWNIDVQMKGVFRAASETVLRNMCEAADARLHEFDNSSMLGYSLQTWDTNITVQAETNTRFINVKIASGFGQDADPGRTLPCVLGLSQDTSKNLDLGYVQIRELTPMEPWGLIRLPAHFSYPANMKIEEAARQEPIIINDFFSSLTSAPSRSQSSNSYLIEDVTVSLDTFAASSFWNHNGSKMALVASGDERSFFYVRPRAGLLERGVRPGTLLFKGQRDGGNYSGIALIFGPNICGAFPYPVSGLIGSDQRSVTLSGSAPQIEQDCSISGYRDDILLFSLE